MAKNKFARRKEATKAPDEKNIMIFAVRDLTKISVNPTSWYHHQSVIKETMTEKKIKITKARLKNVQEKNLVIFKVLG